MAGGSGRRPERTVAQQQVRADPIAARTAGMQSQAGFIPIHYDEKTGRVFLEVARLDQEFLYVQSLATGLGAVRPRLDRGTIGSDEALVRFERHGPRIVLVARNTYFRALTADVAERRTVEESFPTSVLAAFPIETEAGGRFLVDATDLFLSDVMDVGGQIRGAGLGEPRVDRGRSYILMENTKAFPRNTEVRAVLTFATDDPAALLRRHAPDGRAVTFQQHHSFVELPGPGFRPRKLDPRVGSSHVEFWDFAQGYQGEYRDRYILRWRLEKRNAAAAVSEPVEPIVYYLDPGMPEPFRTAVREGAMWWNQVFEAAGFRNAFQVRDLPEGADPMDARYSVILWVHLAGQQPSTGPAFADPRTGEIIKAAIRMESFRPLQSYNFFAGMRPAIRDAAASITAEEYVVSMRRWHAAHEVGHTLGFAHNFIADYQGRTSVMDYRGALIALDGDSRLVLSGALRDGMGAYDTVLVRYAYTPFDSPEAEATGLAAIVRDARQRGLRFLTGRDAELDAAVPQVHRWVAGTDILASLDRAMAVRKVLLERFDESAIEPGQPMSILAERLAHIYVHHRFYLDAVTKYLGGLDYSYALRGDGQTPTRFFPPADQRRALGLIVSAMSPEALAVPERVAAMIPPPPFGYDAENRFIRFPTGTAFDPLALARGLAYDIVAGVFHRERAARLVSFHARNPENLSLDQVISALVAATWGAPVGGGAMDAALRHVTQRAVLDGLFALAADSAATAEVRSAAEHYLTQIRDQLGGAARSPAEDRMHRSMAQRDIDRFLVTGEPPALRTGVFTVDPYYHWP